VTSPPDARETLWRIVDEVVTRARSEAGLRIAYTEVSNNSLHEVVVVFEDGAGIPDAAWASLQGGIRDAFGRRVTGVVLVISRKEQSTRMREKALGAACDPLRDELARSGVRVGITLAPALPNPWIRLVFPEGHVPNADEQKRITERLRREAERCDLPGGVASSVTVHFTSASAENDSSNLTAEEESALRFT
jgi:hypothetical protein